MTCHIMAISNLSRISYFKLHRRQESSNQLSKNSKEFSQLVNLHETCKSSSNKKKKKNLQEIDRAHKCVKISYDVI